MKRLPWFIFSFIILLGCQPKGSSVHQQKDQQAKGKRTTDASIKEVVISNIFTEIVDSLCISTSTADTVYTNLNTAIFVLNPDDSTDCFVFASEITCGFLPGSCGRDIQVIKRKKKGGYRVVFSTCGHIFTTINEKNDNILSFLYGTQDGYIVKVYWDGREFEDKTVSINNISYDYIIKIAEATRHNPSDFVLFDPHHPNTQKIPVLIEDFSIGTNKAGKRFKVLFEREPQLFIFEKNEHPRLILTTSGNDSLQVLAGSGKEYFDILIQHADPDATQQIWKYNYKKNRYTRY